jgi:hypothetical protein
MISYLELYCEKVDKDEVSYNKGILHFFSYDPHIFHIPKIIFGVIRTLIIKQTYSTCTCRNHEGRPRHLVSTTPPKVSLSATALQGVYIELVLYIERSLPAWVVVRITNGMATDLPTKGLSLEKVEVLLALLGGVMFRYRIASLYS